MFNILIQDKGNLCKYIMQKVVVSDILTKFNCDKCKYNTNNKSNYLKHLQTIKHKNNNDILENNEDIYQDLITTYKCDKCKYTSNNRTNYFKHLETIKHKKNENVIKIYDCICGKEYKHRQSLFNHKSNCICNIKWVKNSINNKTTGNNGQNIIINYNYYNTNVKNIQNNKFSIKNYLNNDCKDAFTVQNIIDNFNCDILKLPSKTIEFYKDIVDNALMNIPIEKYPIRCSDTKRNKFYGKTVEWNENYDVIKEFIMKLIDNISELRKEVSIKNPGWYDNDIISLVMYSIIKNISKIYDESTLTNIKNYIANKTKIKLN